MKPSFDFFPLSQQHLLFLLFSGERPRASGAVVLPPLSTARQGRAVPGTASARCLPNLGGESRRRVWEDHSSISESSCTCLAVRTPNGILGWPPLLQKVLPSRYGCIQHPTFPQFSLTSLTVQGDAAHLNGLFQYADSIHEKSRGVDNWGPPHVGQDEGTTRRKAFHLVNPFSTWTIVQRNVRSELKPMCWTVNWPHLPAAILQGTDLISCSQSLQQVSSRPCRYMEDAGQNWEQKKPFLRMQALVNSSCSLYLQCFNY